PQPTVLGARTPGGGDDDPRLVHPTSVQGYSRVMTLAPERAQTFDSHEPSTGAVYATFPVQTDEEVRTAVGRARIASAWWQSIGYDGRKQRLDAWRAVL